MPAGPFFTTDPISLTLAADHTFLTSANGPDIVWQLSLEQDLPISLLTTLGLQAQSFRILPQVARNKHPFQKLNEFLSTPRIDSLSASYASLSLTPDKDTQAVFEFWATEPCAVSGRITLRNTGSENADLSARVAGLLVPLNGEQGLTTTKLDNKTYLRGQSGELTAALTMDGFPRPIISPIQALEISQTLLPGEDFSVNWRCSLAFSPIQSQQLASKPFPANWQAEVARHEVAEQARTLEIETPLHDWNLVFKSMQDQANQLIKQSDTPDQNAPEREFTFFTRRNIYNSISESLSSKPRQLNSENASLLDVRQFVRALLPAQVEVAVALVKGILAELRAQTKRTPPFPQLAALVWDVHTYLQQPPFLSECLPLLVEQTLRWFSPQQDQDQDGLPEWHTPEQAALSDLPLFDLQNETSMPTLISRTESLGLASLLSDELDLIQRMARVVGDSEVATQVHSHQERLEAGIARFRSEHPTASFIDRDTHRGQSAQMLADLQLPTANWVSVPLLNPARLNIRLKSQLSFLKPGAFQVFGADADGNELSETIEPRDMLRLPTHLHITTQSVFSRFDRLAGLDLAEGSVQVYTSDLDITDVSQQVGWERGDAEAELPGWAAQNDLRYRFGLPTDLNPGSAEGGRVNVGWNCLVIEHLNRIGEKKLAFDLFGRLMLGCANQLKREHTLMEGFTSDTGSGWGKRNSLRGLIPPLLLLDLAGIQIINEQKVSISGENPCPWLVIVRFRGLEVRREGKNAAIQFPDGTIEHHFGSSGKLFTSDSRKDLASRDA